ncbi:MAG: Fic family protein [Bacteriovorax sp.]|jgi:Fic family protein
MKYSFSYSKYIVDIIRSIERELASINPNPTDKNLEIQLRKKNQIQTIVGTCQIEGNTLTQELVTEVLKGKKILGKEKEIIEVKNAFALYEATDSFNPSSKRDFLNAHKLLMQGLDSNAGKIRKVNVGVGSQKGLKYIAPPFREVPELINDLFEDIQNPEYDEITTSALLHLKIESIHPFVDGNGRIGRFWQTLYLATKVNYIFQFLNIEGLVKENQEGYYKALIKSQTNKNSNYFVEFSLELILEALKKYKANQQNFTNGRDRVLSVKGTFKTKLFSRSMYMKAIGVTSSATASRDLVEAVEMNILESIGEKNQTKYKFRK